MQIYLPIAEMAVSAETIFILSAFVGFLSSLFGIGGGFLTTPFLIFIGISPGIAVGTQPLQSVANGMSGMLGHMKKGNVDFKMGGIMLAGGVIGSYIGVLLFQVLQRLGYIDFIISFLYVILLGTIGLMMLRESMTAMLRKGKTMRMEFNKFHVPPFIARLPFKMRFNKSALYISALLPLVVGFAGGFIAAILGIGGGFLLVPAMIYLIGMPAVVVAGTSLFQIVFTTAVTAVLHAITNQTVDVYLAAILIFGGVIGAQAGVAMTGKLKPVQARLALGLLVLLVASFLTVKLVKQPKDVYSTEILHIFDGAGG